MRKLIVAALIFAGQRHALAQEKFPGVDRETSAQLQRIVTDVTARGLPVEPIIAKVQQAITMKAPASRMLAAAEAVARRLEQAREALAPALTEGDIVAGADALSVGVTPKSVHRVRVASPRDPVAVPLGVLAQLVANHVSQDRATDMVIGLLTRGVSNAQLASLGNDVNGDISRGGNPDDAFDIRVRGLVPLLGSPSSATAASPSACTLCLTGSGPKKP
jgi:hypothetical protein